jgi:hypothetical protein
MRIDELAGPRPVDATYNLQDVVVLVAELAAHPFSGAEFELPRWREISVEFSPYVRPADAGVPGDGVTFEVRVEGRRVYSRHVMPGERVGTQKIEVAADPAEDRPSRVAFLTDPGPAGNRNYDWAIWQGVFVRRAIAPARALTGELHTSSADRPGPPRAPVRP